MNFGIQLTCLAIMYKIGHYWCDTNMRDVPTAVTAPYEYMSDVRTAVTAPYEYMNTVRTHEHDVCLQPNQYMNTTLTLLILKSRATAQIH